MNYRFSKSIQNTSKSFIREILKLTQTADIISFAGGLPNKEYFPIDAIRAAADKVLKESGQDALQYSTTEGYLPLRKFVSDRYKTRGLEIAPENILILNGSQQAMDLVGKVFLDCGDSVLIEEPSYLGAIQAFNAFSPKLHHVPLEHDGINIAALEKAVQEHNPKLFYSITNFQNPTGLTYSLKKRQQAAEIMKRTATVFVEDDPYGELRFIGEQLPPMTSFAQDNAVLLGSFSKIAAPGLRMGWVCAPTEIMDKLIIAKQGTDLHSNYYTQRVLSQYLAENDIEAHIEKIKKGYHSQRKAMTDAMKEFFPADISYTEPEGGMFLWVTMPEGWSAMELFETAVKHKVAFVPGEPFYADGRKSNSMRLNYTCSNEETIRDGVKRLANAINEYRKTKA